MSLQRKKDEKCFQCKRKFGSRKTRNQHVKAAHRKVVADS